MARAVISRTAFFMTCESHSTLSRNVAERQVLLASSSERFTASRERVVVIQIE